MFDTREKKERSVGTRLFLKPFRSQSPKAAMVRRPQRPGMHGKAHRRAPSEFSQQLSEKQKKPSSGDFFFATLLVTPDSDRETMLTRRASVFRKAVFVWGLLKAVLSGFYSVIHSCSIQSD